MGLSATIPSFTAGGRTGSHTWDGLPLAPKAPARNLLKSKYFMVFSVFFTFALLAGTAHVSFADSPPPLKQMMMGTMPQDVTCNGDLVLLIKNDGNPACVGEDHVFKLLQTGWAVKIINEQAGTGKTVSNNGNDTRFPQSQESPPDHPGFMQAPGNNTGILIPDDGSFTLEESMDMQPATSGGKIGNLGGSFTLEESMDMQPRRIGSESIGFAVGGAQDINNFRENIENDFLPLPTDITYEGLFYDYYFDTGRSQECEKLFCPSYSYAISRDPFSKDDDYYLSVGLNSGIKESDFERKKLNLVIVLDVSGSMGNEFNNYHYDDPTAGSAESETKTKMQLANESLVGLIEHLNDEDRLGVVLFNDNAHISKPLERITDREALGENIMQVYAGGGTNMGSGLKLGTSLFYGMEDVGNSEYENRIIFLTDAMPNLGDTSDTGLLGMINNNAREGIYTTFIGIGVDLNTELVEKLTKARGSNYYSVHSASEFKNRMVEEFEFMVTPLVFNLLLNLNATGYEINKVYGSPESDEMTGQIMKVNTLFPSKAQDGKTKGGIVLLKLEKTSEDATLVLETSYEDREGRLDGQKVTVSIGGEEPDFYENSGIRKGILLSRYAELMKTWAFDQRSALSENPVVMAPPLLYDEGIHIPPYVENVPLGQWERQSLPLQVSDEYEELIAEFGRYFQQEADAIDDETLERELEILSKLEGY